MKLNIKHVLFLSMALVTLWTACEKEDEIVVPERATRHFSQNYDSISNNVKWYRYYNQYHVDFNLSRDSTLGFKATTAKYTYGGDWLITQTPLSYNDIPNAILDALYESVFQNWRVQGQSLEETPVPNTTSSILLYRLVMYDNAETKPLYFEPDGTMVNKGLN